MNINMSIAKTIKTAAKLLNTPVLIGIMLGVSVIGGAFSPTVNIGPSPELNTPLPAEKAVKTIKVIVTAYSSTPDQTDDTPFITASGKYVRDGIVANNMLPMGTKIKIPELYGEKIFVVEDRMNRRKSNYHVDIWFPEKQLAVNFGVKTAEIEVIEN